MEYEKTDQGGKTIKWHVDEENGVPRKVHIVHILHNGQHGLIIVRGCAYWRGGVNRNYTFNSTHSHVGKIGYDLVNSE